MPLTKRDYEQALFSQSACNASGLIHSLSELMPRIREEVSGTDQVNNHPIMRLYVEQLNHLCGSTSYFEADKLCRERSKVPDPVDEGTATRNWG